MGFICIFFKCFKSVGNLELGYRNLLPPTKFAQFNLFHRFFYIKISMCNIPNSVGYILYTNTFSGTNLPNPVADCSQLGPAIELSILCCSVHTTTHCRFYREQMGRAPPKAGPVVIYSKTSLYCHHLSSQILAL